MLRANKCSEANESRNASKYNKTLAPEPAGGGGRESFRISEFNRGLRIHSFKHKRVLIILDGNISNILIFPAF